MSTQEKILEIIELRNEISQRVLPRTRDQYERDAVLKIGELLAEIEAEYTSGTLKPKDCRYGYISRLVAESDPDVLPPKLGGRLMQVERQYIELV